MHNIDIRSQIDGFYSRRRTAGWRSVGYQREIQFGTRRATILLSFFRISFTSSVDMSVEERRRRPDAPIEPPALLERSITPGYCLAVLPLPPSVARPEFSRPRKGRATQHFPAPMEALGSTLGMPNLPASGVQRGGPQVSTLPPPLPRRPPVYARIRPRTTLLSTSASGRRSAGRYASCRPHWSLSLTLCS